MTRALNKQVETELQANLAQRLAKDLAAIQKSFSSANAARITTERQVSNVNVIVLVCVICACVLFVHVCYLCMCVICACVLFVHVCYLCTQKSFSSANAYRN